MTARKLRLLADSLENRFMTEEDRQGWINDLRGAAKSLERARVELAEEPQMTKRDPRKPTYDELAKAVVELVEYNVANLHLPESRFIKCFTHDFGKFPPVYERAMKLRERLTHAAE